MSLFLTHVKGHVPSCSQSNQRKVIVIVIIIIVIIIIINHLTVPNPTFAEPHTMVLWGIRVPKMVVIY